MLAERLQPQADSNAAKEFAGDRDVEVAAGQIGSQALKLGLIDQVVVNQVPVVFCSSRPFFATGDLAQLLRLENPSGAVLRAAAGHGLGAPTMRELVDGIRIVEPTNN